MIGSNLDEKPLLRHMVQTLSVWGIDQVSQDQLRLAKKDSTDATATMIKVLYKLCLLHCKDFRQSIAVYAVKFPLQDEMTQLIVAHLTETQCPYLYPNGQGLVLMDFSSSRGLLLVCGWVMAVGNIFQKTALALQHRLTVLRSQFQTIKTARDNFNKSSQPSQVTDSAQLAKIIKLRHYEVESLEQKINKLKNKIREKGIPLCNPVNNIAAERHLLEMLTIFAENGRLSQYFWVWLDQKILPSHLQALQTANRLEQHDSNSNVRVYTQVSLDQKILQRFVLSCQSYQQQLQQIEEKIDQLGLTSRKRLKEVQNVAQAQVRQLMASSDKAELTITSFLGLQLSQYMHPPTQSGRGQTQSARMEYPVKETIKQLTESLEGLTII